MISTRRKKLNRFNSRYRTHVIKKYKKINKYKQEEEEFISSLYNHDLIISHHIPKQQPVKKKKVTFDSDVYINLIPSCRELNESQKSEIWWTTEDYEKFKYSYFLELY